MAVTTEDASNFWTFAILVYMLIGWLLFEWSWAQTKALREVNEERDSKYPAYRRFDAHNWKKWKFYPGAIFLVLLRLMLVVICILLCYIFVRITTIGHSFSNQTPLKGRWRNLINVYAYKVFSTIVVYIAGGWMTRKVVEFDYSPYLGPDYKELQTEPKYVSTYVSNHTSLIDIPLLISYYKPAFASKNALKKIPMMGLLVQALGCIFISRGGTVEERNQIVE